MLVDLPSREEIKLAIAPWWRGGGVAEMLIDALRGAMADVSAAQVAAPKLVDLAERGYHITRAMVDEEVEKALAISDRHKQHGREDAKSPNPLIGGDEWIRRATARAMKSEEAFVAHGGYHAAVKAVKWEKPAKQRKR